jgi:hypothetical protein
MLAHDQPGLFFGDFLTESLPSKQFHRLCGGAFKPGQIVCDQTRTVILGGIG